MRQARGAEEIAAAKELRVRVFCDEQGVTQEEELDELDDEALQIVGLDETGVVATCRLRFLEGDCKLERMAVDKRLRGLGSGGRLAFASNSSFRLGSRPSSRPGKFCAMSSC